MTALSVTLLTPLFLVAFINAAPNFTTRRWSYSVVKVLNDILAEFPLCDIILVQDEFFSDNMNSWVADRVIFPYYTITLDGKPFPDYTTWQKITKTTGFLCTTIVAACISFDTCRNSDSPTLFKMLSANGILLKERRTLLYIDKFTEDDVPYSLSKSSSKWAIQHENTIGQEYRVSVLNKAKRVLYELKSHITLIRDVTKQLLEQKFPLRNVTESPYSNQDDLLYETLTFSPNWIPGGTPVIPNLWSKKRGFALPYLTTMNLTQMKPGGTVKFCVSSKHLLPFIDVAANGSVKGLAAELITEFQRHLKINPVFFEPKEKSQESQIQNRYGDRSEPVGFVIRKEADIGLGHVIFTADKKEASLKFSPLVLSLKAVAVCPMPKLLPRYQILAYPFDTTTWICLLVSCALSVLSIEVLQRVAILLMPAKIDALSNSSPDIAPATKNDIKNSSNKLILASTLKRKESKLSWIHTVGVIFLRSVVISPLPRRWAILGLFSIWLVFTFINAAGYVTILIGALSVPPREPYIHSPADLVNNKKEWALSSLVIQAIQNSTVSVEKVLLNKAKSIENLPAYQNLALDLQVYSYVNTTGHCGVSEEYRTKFYIGRVYNTLQRGHNRQLMYVSKGSFFIGATGWVIRDDMDFLIENYFDKLFLHMSAFGFYTKIIHDWFPKHYAVDDPIDPLSIEAISIVFVIGGLGLLGSLIVFLGETITHRIWVSLSLVQSQISEKRNLKQRKLESERIPFTL